MTLVPETIFISALTFCRIGAIFMLAPGIGEIYVSIWVRLALAIGLTVLLVPVLSIQKIPLPGHPFGYLAPIFQEIFIGLLFGGLVRLSISALHVAGTVIAFQNGFASSTFFDPAQGGQSAIIASFISLLGVAVIFATDLHHLLLQGLSTSYRLFPLGGSFPVDTFSETASRIVGGLFETGLRLSAPFIVFGLVFNVGLGALNRLMPSIQVMFIALPLQILIGFMLLFSISAALLQVFSQYYRETLILFGG